MHQLLWLAHILICLALIGLVLLQHGKGADAGVLGSAGGSQTVFGSKGATSFLVKTTALLGFVFFLTCLSLGYFSNHVSSSSLDVTPVKTQPTKDVS